MTTSLASQLQKLAAPQTGLLDDRKRKTSLLFDASEAANYGKDVYFDIGVSGFEELVKIDDAFSAYKDSLFGKTSKDFQRAVADKQTNKKLDEQLEGFLLLLSPYLEKQAAIKALEWLVYRYMVNSMNKRALFMCIFPYYESPLFVRILQIIDIRSKTDEWHWLFQLQKAGHPLTKKTVFNRWTSSQDFRAFLSEYLKKMLKVQRKFGNLKIAVAFFVSTIVGGLCLLQSVKEEQLSYIVSMLPLCLLSDHEELVAGVYLIVGQLSVKTKLAEDLIHNIIKLILQGSISSSTLKEHSVLCLLALCQHQDIEALDRDAVISVTEKDFVMEQISQLAKSKSVAPFFSAYVTGFLRWIVSDYQKSKDLVSRKFNKLINDLQSLPASASDASRIIGSVLEAWKVNFKSLQCMEGSLSIATALNSLEASHPDGYSQAIAQFTSSGKDSNVKNEENKKIIEEILGSGSYGKSVKFIHLVHPDDNIRLAAAENFAKRISKNVETDKKLIELSLGYMLADECPDIVEKALQLKKGLDSMDTQFLIDECKKLLKKCEDKGKGWNKVKRVTAKVLTIKLHGSYTAIQLQDILYVFLPYILCPKKNSDMNVAKIILESPVALEIPLLKALSCEMSVQLADDSVDKTEYSSKLWNVLPKVISDLSACDKKCLWDTVKNQLKQEISLVNQFISLVLVYNGLKDKKMDRSLQLNMAHMVMDFSLLSLDHFKDSGTTEKDLEFTVTSEDCRKYCDEVMSGCLPVNFVAVCMMQALQAFVLPDQCSKSAYWMPDMETQSSEGNLLLLLKAVRGAFDLEQYGYKGTAIRNKLLASVLKDCLKTVERQYYFLSMIWGWHPSLALSNIVDKSLVVWCLNLGSALFSIQSGNLAWMLSSKQPVVPALIAALTSSTAAVRKSAINCMENIASIKGGRLVEDNLSLLVEKILQHSEEIMSDDRQMLMCLYEFKESKPTVSVQVMKSLLGVLTEEVPMHLKMALLYAISCVLDERVLRSLLPLAGNIFAQISSLKENTSLDVATSYTFYYILLRFTPATSEVLEDEVGWNFFQKAVTCSFSVLNVQDELVSPQKVLMEQVMSQKFFASIRKEELQAKLWSHLISCVAESDNPHEASRLRSGLRKTCLDASVVVKQIEALNLVTKVKSMREAQAKRIKQKQQKLQSSELMNWKKLGLMLETIGVMAMLGRPWLLTNILCQCLQQTLNMETVITELVQQQILSALLHLLQKSSEELGKDVNKHVTLNVELIVHCVRSSVSPDTHRRAMLILAMAADIFPEVVLHNMMSIFTFMGTSLLRRDDSYSFQVIHQTIQSIVPTLIKCESGAEELIVKLAKVCQVFVDAFPDLPEHRRLPLFIQLANTIDVEKHLWILLALIADSHVMRGNLAETVSNKEEDRRSVPHIIEFALTVCSEFTLVSQVNACCSLMDYISVLPEDKEPLLYKQRLAKKSNKNADIISWEGHSPKQYMHFKYTSTGLLAQLLSSEKFVAKVVEGSEELEEELQDRYQVLLEKTMSYLRSVSDTADRNKDKPIGKFWMSLQRKVVDVMDGIISVLPPSMLLKVVDGLLTSPVPLVRCRATELLCAKLQPSSSFFSKEDLLDLLPFVDILRKIGTNPKEPIENRQVGLYALQLLIKHLAPHVKIGAIMPVMSAAVQLVCGRDTPVKVITQALLIIAEAVGSVKAHAVNHLVELMPVVTRLLVSPETEAEHLPLAAVTATHKIVENMAQFLAPHLESLICAVCQLCAMKEEAVSQESRLGLRLLAVRDSLPQRIEARLMIPKLTEAYRTLSDGELSALQPLILMVETLITKTDSKIVINEKPALINLFTQALDLRSLKGDHPSIDAVENIVCSALGKLLLRLNEHDNISIFVMLQYWAADVTETKPLRLITFYRFADHLAGTLKVLFIKAKLADNLFSHASSILERNNSQNAQDTVFGTGEKALKKTTVILKYVLDTLTKIFLYDSVHFTNQERFQLMVQPLINQLENTQIGKEAYKDLITNHFIPCVVKFTSAVGDDSLWKDLNRAVLLRLRNDDEPLVILAALETFHALIDAFGEDYLQPLLADIMPFITEVFETLDPEIEAATKEIYSKMETILGDSFRSYLDK